GGGLGVKNGKGRLRGMLKAEADQNAREQTHEQREHWARAAPGGRLWRGSRDRSGARPPRLRCGGAASVPAVAGAAVSVGRDGLPAVGATPRAGTNITTRHASPLAGFGPLLR